MFSRWTYVERGVVTAGLAVAPWVAVSLTDTSVGPASHPALLLNFAIALPICAGLGAVLSLWLHKMLGVRGIEWGGYEETAALLKQAGAELVTGKPEEKLFSAANKQADNQDGRATGIYLFNRMAQLRHTDTFKRFTQPNPIALPKRLFWTTILAAIAALILSWPVLSPARAPLITNLVILVVLAPFFLTALLITGLGLAGADTWLLRIFGLRLPQRSTVKLRRREVKSVAGKWHRQNQGPDIPMFRVLGAFILLVAVTLYALREYDDVIFGPDEPLIAPDSDFETEAVALAAPERPEPAATAKPVSTSSSAAPRTRDTATRAPTPKPVPVEDIWNRLTDNGTLVVADAGTLSYAGWNLQGLQAEFTKYKQDRLDEWYILHIRENPHDLGKVTLRLTLRPQGGVSDIRIVASQIGDSTFTNGLIDRLDAIQLRGVGLDPVSITLAFDFRL